MKTPATMTALMLAATLVLQAQTSSSPSQQTEEQRRKAQQSYSATSPSQTIPAYTPGESSTRTPTSAQTEAQRLEQEKQNANRFSQNPSSATSSSQSQQGELKYSSNQPADVQRLDQQATSTTQGSQTTTAQTGLQSTTSSQTDVAVTTEVDAEVRTVVQQIDAQGPVIVERITTRFADTTCGEENARALVAALHGGTSVTLRGEDGTAATFTPNAKLGYGEAYIAMSLAVEALRQAGITGCASPAQWQAVLMGGQLSGGTVTTTSVTTERFPGILVLREQGGWAKVAQTTNIQLSQVVSQANTNLQLNNASSTASTATTSQQNLSPTGFSRDHDPRATDKSGKKDDDKSKDKDKKDHDAETGLKKGHDEKASDLETPPKSETPPKY